MLGGLLIIAIGDIPPAPFVGEGHSAAWQIYHREQAVEHKTGDRHEKRYSPRLPRNYRCNDRW